MTKDHTSTEKKPKKQHDNIKMPTKTLLTQHCKKIMFVTIFQILMNVRVIHVRTRPRATIKSTRTPVIVRGDSRAPTVK